MASTILLKYGPGAPTSGELEYRELGYDHTNHKLYIGNSSGGVTLLNPTYSLSSFGVTATAAELNRLDGITATTAELNYTDGVTSNIQTQLNGKAASSHTHPVSQVTGLTASRALISDSSGHPAVSSVTSTELGYLDGVTSSIQTQLNGKLSTSGTAAATTKLATARTIRTNLASTSTASFNGTANITPGVTGTLPVANGGTGGTSGLEAANNLKLLYLNGGTKISSGSDLNDYMDSGVYFSGSSSNTIYNKPAGADNAFNMLVFRPLSGSGNTYLVQYLMPFSSNSRIFYRSYDPWASDTNWRPWREVFNTYICNPQTIVIGRNGQYVQELDAYSLTQTLFGEFYASSTVLACNGDRSACTDAIIATTKVSNKVYRLVFDANSTSNMRINLLNFMF